MNAATAATTTSPYRVMPRPQSRDPFVAEVLAAVADEFGLSEKAMMAPSRGYDVWKPRMAAMYYARLLTGCSLPELGRIFGGRSHTTVLRAFRRCRDLIERDEQWALRMDRLLVRLVEKIIVPRARDA
jgi:chromosomal replication initiator protein